MNIMRLLLIAFAPLLASAHEVQDVQERQMRETDPGLRMRLTQHTLDYMTKELLPKVLKSLSDVQLTKGASGTYSNIDYRVWNVKINEVGVKQPGMTFQSPRGIELCLKGITANVSSAWFAKWLFLTDAGMVNVVVPDGQVCASIELRTRNGIPKIKIAQLDVDLRLGPVSFSHSNLHWVMNVGAWLFQSQLEEMASKSIHDEVAAVVKSDLSKMLNSYDFKVVLPMPEVNDSMAIDLSVDSIETKQDYLQVDIRGATSLVNHSERVCPFPQEPFHSDLPATWTTRMASISTSKRTVECFLWLVNSTGMLRYALWPAGVPENPLGLKLDTEFMSILVPGLKEVYPKRKQWLLVEAEVGSEMPTFDFQPGHMDVKVPMIFNFRRLVKPGFHYNTSEFVFSFTADVHGRAELLIKPSPDGGPQRLKAHATLLRASNFQQGTSKAGPVDLMMASQLLAVIRQPAEDALNKDTFSKYVPLGDSSGAFTLPNVNVNISEGGVFFLSDLAFKWTWDRQKVMGFINGHNGGSQRTQEPPKPAPDTILP